MQPFDLVVDVRDPRTGQVTHRNDYIMRISADEGTLYERPPHSGNWFHGNGVQLKLNGRLISELQADMKKEAEAHEAHEAKLAHEVEVKKAADAVVEAPPAKKHVSHHGVKHKVSQPSKEN